MNNIRIRRRALNMTMKELASIVGVTEAAISHYETGRREPDPDMLIRIATALNVSVDFLIGREEETNDADNQSALDQLGPNKRYIAENLPKLNEDQAKIFRALLEQMGIK